MIRSTAKNAATKEPVSRKSSSGLVQLMSALHQNAAAVVTSDSHLNGPDQVRIYIYFNDLPREREREKKNLF